MVSTPLPAPKTRTATDLAGARAWIEAASIVLPDVYPDHLVISSVDDDHLDQSLIRQLACGTSIARVLEAAANTEQKLREAAKVKTVRDLLSEFDGNYRAVSQKRFWDFFEALNEDRGARLFFVDGQHRYSALKELAHLEIEEREWSFIAGMLSARARADILRQFDARFGTSIDQVALADLSEFLTDKVKSKVILSVRIGYCLSNAAVPSTEYWVHCFLLWTGVSPPVFVTRTFPLTKHRTGGQDVPYFRSQSARHRRGYLDGRASADDGKGRPLRCSSPARRAQSGRHWCFRRAEQLGRPPGRSGIRQVGHQFRLDRCRS